MSAPLIYTAPWIFPMDAGAIKDGAIVVDRESILDIGPQSIIKVKWKNAHRIAFTGVLLPALVNCHIHLELSYLRDIPLPDPNEPMVTWIESLLARRQDASVGENEIRAAIEETIEFQRKTGVVLVADIGNMVQYFSKSTSVVPEIYQIYEVMAPNGKRAACLKTELDKIPVTQPISPHAPYSTMAELITALKRRARENNHLYSIHLAESAEERDLLEHKAGAFRNFLEKRGGWDDSLLPDTSFSGSVDYMDSLGVLDDKTLCVHCVHVDDTEIALLAEREAKVCLCPGSNRFLRVGQAPLEKMLAAGILPAIGTDSRASNEELDMWREIRLLRKSYPEVPAATLLAMATLGGARALHRQDDFGALSKGKKPFFLEIELNGMTDYSEKEMFEKIVMETTAEKISWIVPHEAD